MKQTGKKADRRAGTRALQALEAAGVAFEVFEYEHSREMDHGYALDSSAVLGIDPARVFKTLLADVDGTPAVAVVPATGMLDLKALARAAGGKHAVMMEPAAAERVTGYVTGGISPLGQVRRHRTFVDESARGLEHMVVSGGRRTLSVQVEPGDLLALTGGVFAPISRAR